MSFMKGSKNIKKSHDKFNVYRKEKKQDYREYLKKHHIYENEMGIACKKLIRMKAIRD